MDKRDYVVFMLTNPFTGTRGEVGLCCVLAHQPSDRYTWTRGTMFCSTSPILSQVNVDTWGLCCNKARQSRYKWTSWTMLCSCSPTLSQVHVDKWDNVVFMLTNPFTGTRGEAGLCCVQAHQPLHRYTWTRGTMFCSTSPILSQVNVDT